jgi:hypothetical protein
VGLGLTDYGVTATNIVDEVRITEGAPAMIDKVNIARSNSVVRLDWQGGAAPFQVMSKTNLADATWQSLPLTAATNVLLTNAATSSFFQIKGQ